MLKTAKPATAMFEVQNFNLEHMFEAENFVLGTCSEDENFSLEHGRG